MHIEEIIIDGFKSYSTRVPVGPFDRQFNAITGGDMVTVGCRIDQKWLVTSRSSSIYMILFNI